MAFLHDLYFTFITYFRALNLGDEKLNSHSLSFLKLALPLPTKRSIETLLFVVLITGYCEVDFSLILNYYQVEFHLKFIIYRSCDY
jgi:hypothetical protein